MCFLCFKQFWFLSYTICFSLLLIISKTQFYYVFLYFFNFVFFSNFHVFLHFSSFFSSLFYCIFLLRSAGPLPLANAPLPLPLWLLPRYPPLNPLLLPRMFPRPGDLSIGPNPPPPYINWEPAAIIIRGWRADIIMRLALFEFYMPRPMESIPDWLPL